MVAYQLVYTVTSCGLVETIPPLLKEKKVLELLEWKLEKGTMKVYGENETVWCHCFI